MSDGTDYDDSNPAIIYSGDWQALTGTISQQFDNTVHQTSVNGASATIKFTGTRITVYQTVPGGDGTPVSVDINFDGDTSSMSRITRPGQTYYQDRWFDSGPLTNGVHLLVLTNAGANGETPLILDRFNIEGTLIGSSHPVVVTTTTSSQAQAPAPVPSTQSITSANSNTPSNTNANSNTLSTTSGSPSASTTQGLESVSSTIMPTGTESLSLTKSPKSGSTTPTPASAAQTIVSVQYITNANGSVSASTIILSSSSTPNHATSNHGIPLAMILGLSIASLVVIVLFILLIICLARRRRKAARLEDDGSKPAKPLGPTDVSPFYLDSQRSLTSSPEGSNTQDMSMGLGRKINNTSTTNRRESTTISMEPPSSRGQSEKSSELFSSANEPTTTSAPASDTANRIPETDAGPYRPTYLGRDMVIYALMPSPSDTNGPPPYQSASHRGPSA